MRLIKFILAAQIALMSIAQAQVYQGYEGTSIYPAVVIASGSASSAAVSMKGFSLVGINFPASFSGSSVTFAAADTLTGSYSVVKSTTSGTTLTYTVSASNYSAIDPKDFYGIKFLKIVSNGTQNAPRTLSCSLKGF